MFAAAASSRRACRKSGSTLRVATATAALLISALLPSPAHALFGFGSKRFQYEGLINTGSLGLEGVIGDGEVVALSHANADHFVDAFVLNQDRTRLDIYVWDHTAFTFRSSPASAITAPSGQTIVNVVPGDFDYDGRLDVMLMTQSKSGRSAALTDELRLGLYLGQPGGGFASKPLDIESSTVVQPVMLDSSGDMRTDFIAHPFSSTPSTFAKGPAPLQIWRNNFTASSRHYPGSQGFVRQDLPFFDKHGKPVSSSCLLAHPHSSAFVDLNGDCLADVFLVCQSSSSSTLTYEIWIAVNDLPSSDSSSALASGYVLSSTGNLPAGAGALSFADMDRDGTIDVVFPSCDSGSNGECYINIAYNRQIPLCVPEKEGLLGGLGHGGGQRVIEVPGATSTAGADAGKGPGQAPAEPAARTCRQPGELCTADPSFRFNFSPESSNKDFLRLPISEVLRAHVSDKGRPRIFLTDPHPPSAAASSGSAATPLPLHLGDFNKDGYPDILLLTSGTGLRTSAGSKASGSSAEGRVWLLQNVHTSDASSPVRTFSVVDEGAEALQDIRDARGASWMDVDEDGTLDILLQRTGADGGGKGPKVTFIQNNFFHDAFFLKALTLNGACQGFCTPEGQPRFKPWGDNYGGASYKFTVLDTNGQRKAQQVGQLPQTGYRSLLTPYSYFGLGRTNNYVETLFVGSTRRRIPPSPDRPNAVEPHYLVMEGVVPNSEVLISPWEERIERPPPPSSHPGGEIGSPDIGPWMAAPGASTSTWRRELFLQPGDWIPWVTVVLVTVVLLLGAIVFVLHLQEKREDERERKRAVHEINFAAL
ncbi:hypothetical protein OC844_000157 [Tilletia horrida]|nr:hypothetical protein OC844_000157 [Tilletia horrida]